MVSVPFTGSDAVPTVRQPLFAISFGGGGPAAGGLRAAAGNLLGAGSTDPWQAHVVSLSLEAGCAPGVDAVEIMLSTGAAAPQVAIGDTGSVSLGYTDSAAALVFTGQVDSVRYSVHGTRRITATNGGVPLARLRLNQSYEQQKAGDIVRDLASQASVETDTVENGVDLPFYILDDRRNAYQHIAALARASGYLAYMTPEGKLCFAPFTGGQAVQTFTYGVDILALDLTEAAPAVGMVTTVGEGAAGSQGPMPGVGSSKTRRRCGAVLGMGLPHGSWSMPPCAAARRPRARRKAWPARRPWRVSAAGCWCPAPRRWWPAAPLLLPARRKMCSTACAWSSGAASLRKRGGLYDVNRLSQS